MVIFHIFYPIPPSPPFLMAVIFIGNVFQSYRFSDFSTEFLVNWTGEKCPKRRLRSYYSQQKIVDNWKEYNVD